MSLTTFRDTVDTSCFNKQELCTLLLTLVMKLVPCIILRTNTD